MGGVGPTTGGVAPVQAGRTRTNALYPEGMPRFQLPTDLFDALQIPDKRGGVLTAAQARPRGFMGARELWDLYDYAHQVAEQLSPELRNKYGIVPGTNPFSGRNPWGYPGAGSRRRAKQTGVGFMESQGLPTPSVESVRRPGGGGTLINLLEEEETGRTILG